MKRVIGITALALALGGGLAFQAAAQNTPQNSSSPTSTPKNNAMPDTDSSMNSPTRPKPATSGTTGADTTMDHPKHKRHATSAHHGAKGVATAERQKTEELNAQQLDKLKRGG